MKKISLVGFSLFFLVFSVGVIIATPPSGNPAVGTHYCENDAHNGDQEYIYEGGGVWSGPYECPNGCSKVGTGGQCKSTPKCGDGSGGVYFFRAIDPECTIW